MAITKQTQGADNPGLFGVRSEEGFPPKGGHVNVKS